MDYPKTRKEAIEQGATHYFTGQPCKRGHVALRKTKGSCVECLKEDWKNDLEKRKDYFTAQNHSEAGKARRRKYYEKNREAVIARAQARPPEEVRRYKDKYKALNPDAYRAYNKHRREKHRLATPEWLTREHKQEIRDKYVLAMRMTREFGTPYVVDHIVPLRGEKVSGLHVPWNLKVMSRDENLKKSNSHDNTHWIIYTPENPFKYNEVKHASQVKSTDGINGRGSRGKIGQGTQEGGAGVYECQQGHVDEETPATRQENKEALT